MLKITEEQMKAIAASMVGFFNPPERVRQQFEEVQRWIEAIERNNQHEWECLDGWTITCKACGIWFCAVQTGRCPERID